MELKDLLNELRETRGLNKQELANKIDISRSYISTIESGKVKKPTKKILLKLAYVFDPENKYGIYNLLLSSAGYDLNDSDKVFQEYIDEMTQNFSVKDKIKDKSISEMNFRVNKDDNSMVSLDYPYMDIEWLLKQDKFKVFLGNDIDNPYIDINDNKKYYEPFILSEKEKESLKNEVDELKEAFLFRRRQKKSQETLKEVEVELLEYKLIFDILNNDISDDKELIERLALIDDDREIFLAEEYHEAIKKYALKKDVEALKKLINLKTINDLKEFLSNFKEGD
ncbi:helix-turn-helix domain-containing protein [Mammaliicoccus sciuri]|uniref:helix-turn-helix domain-containing protein n=1 Tax=Mammaliicoccus sciuri TaxID=1296 RepID=UPI001FB3A3AD|nr:helix-turn-helix transcriptional regulator [Mammaliicoccus sciuri]MCJ0939157.1 helix-turn-helix transcriptional regulator [Mammaliicoccus sciuri]